MKRVGTLTHTSGPHKHHFEGKKIDIKGQVLWDSIAVKCPGWADPDTKQAGSQSPGTRAITGGGVPSG